MSSISDAIQKVRDSLSSLGKRGGGSSSEGSSGSKFDPKAALTWVKSHPVIVVSIAIMVVAPCIAWWFSSDIYAARDAAATKRVQEMAALEKLEKSSVEIALPGVAAEQKVGVLNENTVLAYKKLADRLRADAQAIQKAALAHNQQDRAKLVKDVTVTRENVNLIAEEVFDAVQARAATDLKESRAGKPPSDQGLLDQLQRRQDQFIAAERKADRKSLNEEQLARLQHSLVDKRLQLYADAAANTSFYADVADLGLPAEATEAGTPPSETKMFLWQWRLWVIEDVLKAVNSANKPYRGVVDAPVKRILSLVVREDSIPKPAAAAAATEEVPAEGSTPPADGAAAGATGAADAVVAAPVAPALPPLDPKAVVKYDFAKSMTGRVSNSMYDVRYVTVRMVVATSMIPEVLNAIARQNFMTVTGMDVRPTDAFEAADEGFIYGAAPVSEVKLTIESVWLRPWIAKLMPRELQTLKGTDGRTTEDPPASAPAAEPTT